MSDKTHIDYDKESAKILNVFGVYCISNPTIDFVIYKSVKFLMFDTSPTKLAELGFQMQLNKIDSFIENKDMNGLREFVEPFGLKFGG